MKMEEMRYATRKMNTTGTKGYWKLSPSGIISLIRMKPSQVVVTEMHTLAMNMNTVAIPETMENLAEFLRIRRKA